MKIKHIIMALFILMSAIFINIITYFAAFALTVLTGGVDVSDAANATVNQSIFNLLRYICSIAIFGWFYLRGKDFKIFPKHSQDVMLFLLHPSTFIFMLILAASIQLGTDGLIAILTFYFKDFFSDYNKMMEAYTAEPSFLFLFTVIILGPVSEELLFRGLILRQMKLAVEKSAEQKRLLLANVLQAALFALYHGNLIQGIYAFIFGMLLGDLYIKTDSLIMPICLHILINGSLFIIPDGFYSNTMLAILITPACVPFGVLSYIHIKRKYAKQMIQSSENTSEKQ